MNWIEANWTMLVAHGVARVVSVMAGCMRSTVRKAAAGSPAPAV